MIRHRKILLKSIGSRSFIIITFLNGIKKYSILYTVFTPPLLGLCTLVVEQKLRKKRGVETAIKVWDINPFQIKKK